MNQTRQQIVDDLTISVDTLEYRMRASKPPIADFLTNCFAVVQMPKNKAENGSGVFANEAIVELLTVSNDNQLLHVKRDKNSDSGWRADNIEVPKIRHDGQKISGKIEQISAFYQGQKIYAMLHYPSSKQGSQLVVAMVYSQQQGWQELTLSNNVANALHSTKQTDVYRTPNGYHFFYGISTAYETPQFFVVFETKSGIWQAVNESVNNPQASYRLLPHSNTQGVEHTLLETFDGQIISRDFTLDYDDDGYYIEWGDSNSKTNIVADTLREAQVHTFPSRVGSKSLLLHSKDRQLHYIAGYADNNLRHITLTGQANQPAFLESISIGRDKHDRATVFAISAKDRRLWILRQTGFDENHDLTFADWVCLGNVSAVAGCPRAMLDGAELFLVDANSRQLQHLRQNPETTIWHKTEITVAEPDSIAAQEVAVHAVDITAIDHLGAPVTHTAFELQSDISCDVSINGIVRHLNSQNWLKLNSDLAGRLSIILPADNLTAPNLKIKVSSTGQIFSASPDQKVIQRLRGKDPRVQLDVMSMRKAGLIPEQVKGEAANNIVSLIQQVGKATEKSEGLNKNQSKQANRFSVNSDSNSRQNIQRSDVDLSVVNSVGQFQQKMPNASPRAHDNDIFLQLGQLAGDFINWLENAWQDVKKFVVTVANDTVQILLTIGDSVRELVVNTAEGILRAFEAVFQGIAQMFRDIGEAVVDMATRLVNFVQALFGWEDILVTNDTLQHSVNDMLGSAEQFFDGEAARWIRDKTEGLKSGVDDVFDKLEDMLGGMDPNKNQQQLAKKHSIAGSLTETMENNSVSSDMLQNQIQRDPEKLNKTMPSEALDKKDPLQEFVDNLSQSYRDNIQVRLSQIADDFNPQSIGELFSQGTAVVVKALRIILHFAIDIGGNILATGLRLAGKVLKGIKDVLNTPIKIPIISDFYKEHSNGRELKIMDVVTLLVAIPMTIVYKLVFGGKELSAPFAKKDVDHLKTADFNFSDLASALTVLTYDKPNQSNLNRLSNTAIGAATKNKLTSSLLDSPTETFIPTFDKLQEWTEQALAAAVKWAKELLIKAKEFFLPLLKPLGILAGFFDILYGGLNSFKNLADAHDVTGTTGTIFRIIGYIAKVIMFAFVIPSLVVKAATILTEPSTDSQLPMLMAIGSLIAAIAGFVFSSLIKEPNTMMIIDIILGILLFGLVIYTIVALIYNQNITHNFNLTTSNGLREFASTIGAVPGLFTWLIMAAKVANMATPGSGSPLAAIVCILDIVCNGVAGISNIIAVGMLNT